MKKQEHQEVAQDLNCSNKEQYHQNYKLQIPKPNILKHYSLAPNGVCFDIARTKYALAVSRERAKVEDKIFEYNGQPMNRVDMMKLVIALTYEGLSLPEIVNVESFEKFPTAMEIDRWRSIHPDFDRELKTAEKFRAELLAQKGLEYVINAGEGKLDKNKISHAKIANDALIQHAGFLSNKFQSKQNIQITEDGPKNEEEALERLNNLLSIHPELREMIMPKKENT